MSLYYTDKQQAETTAADLQCCGFVVTIIFDGTQYIITAKEENEN